MNLSSFSDPILHNQLISLISKEREVLIKILWHLKEVDKRKLYSDHKCGSLFEYAVKVLKYSEAQASRRVSACRLLRDMPQLAAPIEQGEINLTQLGYIKEFFESENVTKPELKVELIKSIKGCSTRHTQELLDKLRRVPPERVVNLKLKQQTMDKLGKLKALKAHKYTTYDELLMAMSAEVTKAWIPMCPTNKSKPSAGDTRYVPVAIKARVWSRDKGKCNNCGSEYALQLDHIEPFAKGGRTIQNNLQLLCRNCNQRKNFKDLGVKTYGRLAATRK